jgi:4-amino-4-deoxy-L-arabinose transferase-like glycosyltransferase
LEPAGSFGIHAGAMSADGLLRTARYRRVDVALLCGLGVVVAAAVGMRAWGLDHVPGVNGDEAWYGVQMLELRDGRGAWTTPRGNLLNPFFSAPIFLMHLVFEPDFWILRVPALLSGLALIPLTFVFVRRLADEPTAVFATLLAAVLPINLAYSRHGWDPSQSTLVVLITLFCAARRRWWWLAASLLAAAIVHPTNVFVVPVVAIVALAASLGPRDAKSSGSWRSVLALAAVAVPMLCYVLLIPRGSSRAFTGVAERLGDGAAWAEFVVLFSRLFSGVTAYEYFAGDPGWHATLVHDVGFWFLCLPVVALAVRRSAALRDWRSLSWLVGTVAALLIFFTVAGPRFMQPHRERYALWLVMPSTIGFALCCRALITSPRAYRWALAAGLLIASLALASFARHYLADQATTGGRSAVTFRTAGVEPKAQALDLIRADAGSDARAQVLAGNWWLYWPLRYRAADAPGLFVVAMREEDHRHHLQQVLEEGGYVVGFVGGRIHRYVFWSFRDSLREWTVTDYGNRPLLGVWRLEPPRRAEP